MAEEQDFTLEVAVLRSMLGPPTEQGSVYLKWDNIVVLNPNCITISYRDDPAERNWWVWWVEPGDWSTPHDRGPFQELLSWLNNRLNP